MSECVAVLPIHCQPLFRVVISVIDFDIFFSDGFAIAIFRVV